MSLSFKDGKLRTGVRLEMCIRRVYRYHRGILGGLNDPYVGLRRSPGKWLLE